MEQFKNRETALIQLLSKYLFPVALIPFIFVYFVEARAYNFVLREDSFIEWLTFASLIAAAIVSLIIALGIKRKYNYMHWFFVLFFCFNLLAGFEEISWGQRVFNVETTGVFQKYSDQNEMNLHNTFQGMFKIKTKHIALLALFVYGVILPILFSKGRYLFFQKTQLIVPPRFLIPGFTIATVLMLDFPTGKEEELGEFFFGVCFLLMLWWNFMLLKHGDYFKPAIAQISQKEPLLSESTLRA